MRGLTALAVLLVTASLLPWALRAFVPILTGQPGSEQTTIWSPGAGVTYKLNSQIAGGWPNLEPGSNAVAAIDAAMARVGAATGLSFSNGGSTSLLTPAPDGTSLVTFADTPSNRALTFGLTGAAFGYLSLQTGRLFEMDALGNPVLAFSTAGTAGRYDVETLITTLAGIGVGLDYSPLFHACLHPRQFTGTVGRRRLTEDDRAGFRRLYGGGSSGASLGIVTGTLLKPPGQPVAGGHVFLVDAITGRAVTGGLSRHDGGFLFDQVPPGLYHLYAEPLDGPFTPAHLLGPYWGNISVETGFRTAVLGGLQNPQEVVVKPGQATPVGAFQVFDVPHARDISQVFFNSTPTPSGAVSTLEQVAPFTGYMGVFGTGVDQIADAGWSLTGPFLHITGPATWQSSGSGFSDRIMPLSVDAQAPPGSYLLRAHDPVTTELVVFGGCLRVLPPPQPRAFVAPYGSPCPPGPGAPQLTTSGPPSLGSLGFTLIVSGVVPGQPVLLVFSGGPDKVDLVPGCTAWVDLQRLTLPLPGIVLFPAATTVGLTLPIPNDTALSGAEGYVQAVVTHPGVPSGYALTNALMLHVE